jgi:hypothetical protein
MRSAVALIALVLIWAPQRANAEPVQAKPEPRPDVGILLVATPGIEAAAADKLESEVVLGAEAVLRVVPREELAERAGTLISGCTFGPCLRQIYDRAKIELVLVARISQVGSSYEFVISLVDTRSGIPTSQVAESCDVCTVDEALHTATLATVALVTGTGGAEVTAPGGDPTAAVTAETSAESERRQRLLRNAGLIFVGTGAVALVFGAYFVSDDKDALGAVGLSTGSALVAGGTTMLLLSRRF